MNLFSQHGFRKLWLPGLLVAGLCMAGAPVRADESIPLDGYAAQVNDRIITLGEVLMMRRPMERQLTQFYKGPELKKKLAEAFDSTLDRLIERALILEQFKEEAKPLPDRVVDDRIRELIHDRFNDDQSELMDALSREQLTYDEWKKQIQDEIAIQMLQQREVVSRISVAPGDVQDYYQAHKKQYLIPDQAKIWVISMTKSEVITERVDQRNQATNVLKKLRGGADFAAVAKEVSTGIKKEEGGDWGWVDYNELRVEIAKEVIRLQPGEISEVIEVEDAYYIVRVEAKKNASFRSLDEVQQDIRKELRAQQGEKLQTAWITGLKKRYYVKNILSSADAEVEQEE